MPFYLLFEQRIAVSLERETIIGRAHEAKDHLQFVDGVFRVDNKNISYRHLQFAPFEDGLKITQLGSNRTYFNDYQIAQNQELVVQAAGELKLRTSHICELVHEDLSFRIVQRKLPGVKKILYRDCLDFNDEEVLDVLNYAKLQCLILKAQCFKEALKRSPIDFDAVQLVIPPAALNWAYFTHFQYLDDIYQFFIRIGVADMLQMLKNSTPLELFMLNRTRLFESLNIKNWPGRFGNTGHYASDSAVRLEIYAPEDIMRLCLYFADTRELQRFTQNSGAYARESRSEIPAVAVKTATLTSSTSTLISSEATAQAEPLACYIEPKSSKTVTGTQLSFRRIGGPTYAEKTPDSQPLEFSSSTSDSSYNLFYCRTAKQRPAYQKQAAPTSRLAKMLDNSPSDATSDLFAQTNINAAAHPANLGFEVDGSVEKPIMKAHSSYVSAKDMLREGSALVSPLSVAKNSQEARMESPLRLPVYMETEIAQQSAKTEKHDSSVTETPLPCKQVLRALEIYACYDVYNTDFQCSKSFDSKLSPQGANAIGLAHEPQMKKVFRADSEIISVASGDVVYLVKDNIVVAQFKVLLSQRSDFGPKSDVHVNRMTVDDFLQ